MRAFVTICALALSTPAAAQVSVAQATGVAEPTAQQRQALAGWATSVWPDLTPANVLVLRFDPQTRRLRREET